MFRCPGFIGGLMCPPSSGLRATRPSRDHEDYDSEYEQSDEENEISRQSLTLDWADPRNRSWQFCEILMIPEKIGNRGIWCMVF